MAGTPGALAVLHTHNRQLGFHPHVHVCLPAAAFDASERLWRTKVQRGKTPGSAAPAQLRLSAPQQPAPPAPAAGDALAAEGGCYSGGGATTTTAPPGVALRLRRGDDDSATAHAT